MVSVLFDTNILIDHFAGIKEATAELERYEDVAIPSITWLELLSGAEPHELLEMRDYMSHFTVYDLDDVIAEEAGLKVLKSPDSIILPTARYTGRILVTRNSKDFSGIGVHLPYTLLRDQVTGQVFVQTQAPI